MKTKLLEILKSHTQEMEGYIGFGSNPGIPEVEYEDIVDEILKLLKETE